MVCVSYDGFDETEKTIFPDMLAETEKIETLCKRTLWRKNSCRLRLFAGRFLCRSVGSKRKLLTDEQTVKAFEIMSDYFYRARVLYSTSETGEGYLAYWEKKTKSAIYPALHP